MVESKEDVQEKTDANPTSTDNTTAFPKSKLDISSFTSTKKCVLFVSICIFQNLTFISSNLPFSYLPLHDSERNVSTFWTGLILGASSLGLIFVCMGIAPMVVGKFSTRIVLSCTFVGTGISLFVYSLIDFIKNVAVYGAFSVLLRFVVGVFSGIINTAIFAAYVAIYPMYVATVTAIGEAVLSAALAFGPFFGGFLYKAGGFIPASLVPGALIFICAIPAFFLPNLNGKNTRRTEEVWSWTSILDPWVLFPVWNLAAAQIIGSYNMPLLTLYVAEAFDADVVWSGTALLVHKAVVCVASPLVGMLVDKYGPHKMMIASSLCLPLVGVFVGPLPLLSFVTPSKAQVMLSLAFLGLAVSMAAIPTIPAMFLIYRFKSQGKLPTKISNLLVSLYCAAIPFGCFIGTTVSASIAPYASFEWSTGTLGLIYVAQSLLCIAYCVKVTASMKTGRDFDYSHV